MPALTRFEQLLRRFAGSGVEFVLIGGVASAIHGSSRATFDVDLVYDRSDENLTRIVDALAPLHPYLRGAPPGLPFRFDFKTLQNGLNFTLTSDLGDLDLFGEVPGGGVYQNLLQESIKVRLADDASIQVVNLDALIRLKNAAGRARDLEAVAELLRIKEERKRISEE
jgi:predicted nucleotidyltransferase